MNEFITNFIQLKSVLFSAPQKQSIRLKRFFRHFQRLQQFSKIYFLIIVCGSYRSEHFESNKKFSELSTNRTIPYFHYRGKASKAEHSGMKLNFCFPDSEHVYKFQHSNKSKFSVLRLNNNNRINKLFVEIPSR